MDMESTATTHDERSARRVAFKSLGCRVNFEETECLHDRFVAAGFVAVPFDEEADIYVVNTCTVTGLADRESRKVVRRATRRKPEGGLVVVTGCYAQRDPETLRGLDGVDLVLGNTEKAELFEHVRRFEQDRRVAGDIWVRDTPRTRSFLGRGSHDVARAGGMRTRATLKIQDGCDEKCTYCIIPTVRGPSVSRDHEEILREATHLAERGYREIALTGVNTGCFGHDLGRSDGLAELVRDLDGLGLPVRFRLNSLEPLTVTDALLDSIAAATGFAPHFHVPLQHGDSRILRRMGRTYDASEYATVIATIHERFPTAGIGADVMVGFPGETDEHFATCEQLLDSLPLSYLHVFTYSERDGTAATRMPGHVTPATKQWRSRRLHELEDRLRTSFIARMSGTTQTVLVEGKSSGDGRATGLTGNYVRVEIEGRVRENQLVAARIEPGNSPRLARAYPIDVRADSPARP